METLGLTVEQLKYFENAIKFVNDDMNKVVIRWSKGDKCDLPSFGLRVKYNSRPQPTKLKEYIPKNLGVTVSGVKTIVSPNLFDALWDDKSTQTDPSEEDRLQTEIRELRNKVFDLQFQLAEGKKFSDTYQPVEIKLNITPESVTTKWKTKIRKYKKPESSEDLDEILMDLGVSKLEKQLIVPTVILHSKREEFIKDLLIIDKETKRINHNDYKTNYDMKEVDQCLLRMMTYGNSKSFLMTIKQLTAYIRKTHALMIKMRRELAVFDGALEHASGINSYLDKL
jgi:hypothetical protein